MPFELVHLPGSGSVPSWLSDSALAPFVADAVQLEHLLRVVACSAAHRFLLAGARRPAPASRRWPPATSSAWCAALRHPAPSQHAACSMLLWEPPWTLHHLRYIAPHNI